MARDRARGTGLNSSGQTSVEFLFLFLIMLFYLQTVIQPSVTEASNAVIAVNKVGQAKLAAMKVANAVNEVTALSGESSKTIWVFLEPDTNIWCVEADNEIWYGASVGVFLPECNGKDCGGAIKVLDDAALDCGNLLPDKLVQTRQAKIRIWKTGPKTYIQGPLT